MAVYLSKMAATMVGPSRDIAVEQICKHVVSKGHFGSKFR